MVVRVMSFCNVHRMRMINRFQVFKDCNVSTFCDQGSAWFLAMEAGNRVFLFRIALLELRCRTNGLRIERSRRFYFAGCLYQGFFGQIMN